jgi:hypothetical protein
VSDALDVLQTLAEAELERDQIARAIDVDLDQPPDPEQVLAQLRREPDQPTRVS